MSIKKLGLIGIVSILISISCASAQSVYIMWNANSDADLMGYKIYYGKASRVYDTTITLTDTTAKY